MRDWSELEECTCYCRCGAVFRAKHRANNNRQFETDRDCPGCKDRSRVWRASYDPEVMRIQKGDHRGNL